MEIENATVDEEVIDISVREIVRNRDDHKCQNLICDNRDYPLTVHHIKFKKNGGKDKPRNLVTICELCHKRFNMGKKNLVFGLTDNIPPHIRGHTFRIIIPVEIDWKQVRRDSRVKRKLHRSDWHLRVGWKEMIVLLNWLFEATPIIQQHNLNTPAAQMLPCMQEQEKLQYHHD